jgi:membrane protease YdiL (CAAX protease family)
MSMAGDRVAGVFAALPPVGKTSGAVLILNGLFVLFVLASFLAVIHRVETCRREGTAMSAAAPPPFRVSAWAGGTFAVCVLGLLFLQSGLYLLVVVFGFGGMLMESGRTVRDQFGLNRVGLADLVKWSFLICGAVIFIEMPLGWIVDHPEQESVDLFRHITKPAQIAAFLLQAVLLAPMVEELFFRGFLLGFLKNYTSTGFALVLSAGVFAFAHANLGSVVQLWVLGLVLGLAYEHFGSLLLPMGIHACWNFFTALSLLLERGGN